MILTYIVKSYFPTYRVVGEIRLINVDFGIYDYNTEEDSVRKVEQYLFNLCI